MNSLFIIPSIIRDKRDIQMLRRCLNSIRDFEPEQLPHVLLVDDASDTTLAVPVYEQLCEIYGCKVEYKKVRESYSSQINIGARYAEEHAYPFIVTVNNDIELCQRVTVTLENTMQMNPRLSVCGPLLLYPSGRVQSAGFEISETGQPIEYNKHQYYMPDPHVEYNKPRCVEGVTGAFQMIRTSHFRELLGYNEQYLMGFEDVDFCLKVWRKGGWVFYQPNAIVVHCESVTRGHVPCTRQIKSLELFLREVQKQPMGDIKQRIKMADQAIRQQGEN